MAKRANEGVGMLQEGGGQMEGMEYEEGTLS